MSASNSFIHVIPEAEVWREGMRLKMILTQAGEDTSDLFFEDIAQQALVRGVRKAAKALNIQLVALPWMVTDDGDVEVHCDLNSLSEAVLLKLAIG